MLTMEIFFDSLTDEAKTEFVETFGHDDNVESGVFPIATIDQEEDV